jgi:hypothetical protein
MLVLAIVIYVLVAIFLGALWSLEFISGKAGCIGQILVIGWAPLLIAEFRG